VNEHPVKVSVAFITYNHEPFVRQSLDSVLMQETDFPFEIVIGEDCSTDGTQKIVEDYKDKHPDKIRIVTSETNVGPMPNVVRTYKTCKGKYIAVLEGDDYWTDPLKLQKQVELMEANPGFTMCFTDRSVVNETGMLIQKSTIPDARKKTLTAQDIVGSYTPPSQTVLFKRSYLSSNIIESLKKVFNGDTCLFSFLSTKGEAGYIDRITAAYRLNKQGHYTNKSYISRLESKLKTYEELDKLIENRYKPFLRKGMAVAYQRLYVLLFLEKNRKGFFKIFVKMIVFDVKHVKISFLRANKLLLTALFNPTKTVTD